MSRTRRPSLFDVLDFPQAATLTSIDKLVLLYLAWRQGQNRASWPSLRTISRDLHIERRTCLRSIAHLCQSGSIQKTSGQCGRGHSNHYVVLSPEKESSCHLFPPEKRSHPDTGKGVTLTPQKESGRPLNYHGRNNGRNHSSLAAPYSEDFLQVWDAYPRKVGKVDAWAAWEELSPSPELVAQILASIAEHVQSEQWSRSLVEDGGRFVPTLGKFLLKRRWEDELPAPPESDGCTDMEPDAAAEMIAAAFAVDRGQT